MNGIVAKAYCIVEDNGRILMTQDIEGQPGWKFPGGHPEEGELLFETAKREVKEETGYDIEPTDIFHIEDYFKQNGVHSARLFFIARKLGGEGRPQEGEVKELGWFSKEELALFTDAQIYPNHQAVLRKYLDS